MKVPIDLPTYHPGQLEIRNSPAKFNVICAGRRFGKTKGLGVKMFERMLAKPNSIGGWGAPFFKNVRIAFRYMANSKIFPRWPNGFIKATNKAEMTIELINGSIIFFSSLDNPASLLGEGYDYYVADEFARVAEGVWEETLRPSLADRDGSADFISTPKGKAEFYRLFLRGQDPAFPNWASFHFPSASNPYLKKSVIENMRAEMPDLVFRQEVLAEFLDEGAGVFQNIRANFRGVLGLPGQHQTYIIGWDIAKAQDFSVVIVGDLLGRVVHFERFNKIDYPSQMKRVKQICARYNNAVVVLDSTGLGDPIADQMAHDGVPIWPYHISYQSKKQLIEGLQLALERELLTIPLNEQTKVIMHELDIYEYEITARGNVHYSAPPGMHDDCVIALGLYTFGAGLTGKFMPKSGDGSYDIEIEDYNIYEEEVDFD